MNDRDLVALAPKLDPQKFPERSRDRTSEFLASLPANIEKYRHLTEKQRAWLVSLLSDQSLLPSLAVGPRGVLQGPLPCGHDAQTIKSDDRGRYCPGCGGG